MKPFGKWNRYNQESGEGYPNYKIDYDYLDREGQRKTERIKGYPNEVTGYTVTYKKLGNICSRDCADTFKDDKVFGGKNQAGQILFIFFLADLIDVVAY